MQIKVTDRYHITNFIHTINKKWKTGNVGKNVEKLGPVNAWGNAK
jgi:hypothetical protein